ncbi:hypothetical protein AAEX63_06895 [Luteococcus sp. H138]|uniref:hypothetical protein n=1 Tax=unclassified Luteococcus TaxID=2639923 RepID=UPI00313C1EFA
MRRITITVVSLSSLLLPLSPATPARAAGTDLGQASAWAAFSAPDRWVNQADNVHWYVATPALTQSALQKPIRFTVTSPRTIDCANLGAGYQSGGTWTAAPIRTRTCTATRAVVEITPTAAMAGARVTLTGWSAVARRTAATIKGTVRLAGQTRTATSTASRAAAPKPIGPLVQIGTWKRKPVYASSLNGINEIWVGKGSRAVRYASIDGAAWHVGMSGSRVDVWTEDGAELRGWHLDLATGKTTSQELASGEVSRQGKPGFWLRLNGTEGGIGGEEWLYDWAGTRHVVTDMFFARPGRNLGFTSAHAFALEGRQLADAVAIFSLDGTPKQTVPVPGMITDSELDATGVVISYRPLGGTEIAGCRVEAGWTSCQPIG